MGIIEVCAQLQDEFNISVKGADWKEQKLDWTTAIVVELAEAIDHYGYKWWKKQERDIDEVYTELVDVLHFYLSYLLQWSTPKELDERYSPLFESFPVDRNNKYEDSAYIEKLKDLIHIFSGMDNDVDSYWSYGIIFAKLHMLSIMCGDENGLYGLFDSYVKKHALNQLRQNYGYKTGEYQKIWNGKEDNTYLNSISGNSVGEIYTKLEKMYLKYLEN